MCQCVLWADVCWQAETGAKGWGVSARLCDAQLACSPPAALVRPRLVSSFLNTVVNKAKTAESIYAVYQAVQIPRQEDLQEQRWHLGQESGKIREETKRYEERL